jgi:hypothetical protein
MKKSNYPRIMSTIKATIVDFRGVGPPVGRLSLNCWPGGKTVENKNFRCAIFQNAAMIETAGAMNKKDDWPFIEPNR